MPVTFEKAPGQLRFSLAGHFATINFCSPTAQTSSHCKNSIENKGIFETSKAVAIVTG
jgi:hypothetical protein